MRHAHGTARTGTSHSGPRGATPAAATLQERAAAALQGADFAQAIELFKRLVKQEPRPQWRDGLRQAYVGRARALAAKGLFEEAETALAKGTAGGDNPDPLLAAQCLVKRGQWRKAAAVAVDHVGRPAAADAAALAELAAALWLVAPFPLAPANPEAGRWAAQALAAQECLAAWTDGRPPAEVDELLGRIPLRSAFRAVRLVLKSVMTAAEDPARARELVAGIAPASPFAALRRAVEAALPGGTAATPAQQMFAGEVTALPAAVTQLAAHWVKAERSGPGALLSLLAAHRTSLPADDVRKAALALLPAAADQLRKFESSFGPLAQFERSRVQALAAQAKGNWAEAAARWSVTARSIATSGTADAQLAAAVIHRHLAALAHDHDEVEGSELEFLKLSLQADPDHLPTVLQLLTRYRSRGHDGPWHSLAEAAAKRFPEEAAVLLQAMESAMARKAYKKAVGFARRVLVLDPINQAARQRMIELHISHARKQMRSRRGDLAARELAEAAAWEQAPSFLLHINRGLVGLALGDAGAEGELRRGVDVAGGGVAGWFRAALEHALMNGGEAGAAVVRDQLERAQAATAPTREAVVAIAGAVTATDPGDSKAVTALVSRLRGWLARGSALAFTAAEFHEVAAMFTRVAAFDLMADYAGAGGRRHGIGAADAAVLRFYALVAGCRGAPERLSPGQMEKLYDLEAAASERGDFHMVNRIRRFMEAFDDDDDDDDHHEIAMVSGMLERALDGISPDLVMELLETRGVRRTTAALVDILRKASRGTAVPEPVLRRIAAMLIATVSDEFHGAIDD